MQANSTLAELEQALRLPSAKLAVTELPAEQLRLYLLQADAQSLQLNPAEIHHFWQQLPFWAFAWAGGRALAQWLLANPQAVQGKTVVDFGCGSGLVGIAAAKAGAKKVWVSDLDANALAAAQLNAQLNQVEVEAVEADYPEADILLASDVLYDLSSHSDLRHLVQRFPQWLLAERQAVKPDFVELEWQAQKVASTLPRLEDFDEALAIEIYQAKPH